MTTMSEDDPGPCRTCDRSFDWHKKNNPIHPFNDGQAGAISFLKKGREKDKAPEVQVRRAEWPFDPVLRQALINKGVLTPEDLRDAEEQIKAVTAQFAERMTENGQ